MFYRKVAQFLPRNKQNSKYLFNEGIASFKGFMKCGGLLYITGFVFVHSFVQALSDHLIEVVFLLTGRAVRDRRRPSLQSTVRSGDPQSPGL